MCKRAIAGLYVVLFAAFSTFVTSASAASTIAGIVDPTFDVNGTATADFYSNDDNAQAVAVQPDGKIVVVGYATDASNSKKEFALLRYNQDGTLDTKFGDNNNGKVTTPVGTGDAVAFAVAIQPHSTGNDILVAGYADNSSGNKDFVVARYTSSGILDAYFNSTGNTPGFVFSDFGPGNDDVAKAMALQLDGKIVVAGYSSNATNTVFAVARYTPQGQPDNGFGTGGSSMVTTQFTNSDSDYAYGVVVQLDGKIVVDGYSAQKVLSGNPSSSTKDAFALARYDTDGQLDPSFNNGSGTVITSLASAVNDTRAIALQPDGKILVAGQTKDPATTLNVIAVARYDTNGVLDKNFGSNGGVVTTATGATHDRALALAVQPDGKILAAGSAAGSIESLAITRYNPDGTQDTGFNANSSYPGTQILTFGSTPNAVNEAHALALQPDRKIVVAGYTAPTGSSPGDFAVARLFAADNDWGITPSNSIGFTDAFTPTPGPNGSTSTSAMLTISGLGATTCGAGISDCVDVPVNVSKGQYQKGAGAYTTGFGWARNGDQFSVRQDIPANAKFGDIVSTTLTMGGLVAANNYGVILCPLQSTGCPTRYTFTTTVDNQPRISGTPAATVQSGSPYRFAPTASDPDTAAGDTLAYSIQNKPLWASFDTHTGTLTGTPADVDIGANADIQISVTDSLGQSTSLPAFTIDVTGIQSGTGTGGGTGGSGGGGPTGPVALAALALVVLLRRARRTGRQTAASTSLGSA